MEENHKKYIQKHFGEPVENFEPDQLLSYLFQANIINVEDMEKVRSKNTCTEKSVELLLFLHRSVPDAYRTLVDGLSKNKRWLADKLSKEGQ